MLILPEGRTKAKQPAGRTRSAGQGGQAARSTIGTGTPSRSSSHRDQSTVPASGNSPPPNAGVQPAPVQGQPVGPQQQEAAPRERRATDEQHTSSSSHMSALTDDSSGGMALDDAGMGPGLDVLAALASLGISESVRTTVQQALDQLDAAAASAGLTHGAQQASASGQGAGGTSQGGPADKKRLEELEKKLGMSRSIMRKLYHRNVELEKEVQVLTANSSGCISFSVSTADLLARRQAGRTAGDPNLDGLVVQALQERDATVVQLQQALDTARRRCALLESQVSGSVPQQAGRSSQALAGNVKDVLAQSHLHYNKYRQIRDDYNRLLNKRAGTLATNKAASAVARGMVSDMSARLQQEMTEREAEAALYSARLYETERQMSDWYVERRMLEEHISQLNADIAQRDQLDSEIESCMCGLFERLKVLEADNEQMRQQMGKP